MSVTVEKLISDFDLEVLVEGEKDVKIPVNDINRPGLQLAGFYNYFAPERIQVIGKAEWSFLDDMGIELMRKRVNKYFSFNSKCVIMTRGLEPHSEFLKVAKKSKTWLLRTNVVTTKFISKLTMYLAGKLAPETRLHGVLVDVYGIGVLIKGESSIGKSETALELIQKGHRLVADDAVEIRKVDESRLVGQAPELLKHYMEIRGIGIIDVKSLYGVGAIKNQKAIDLVIELENWNQKKYYDRLGLDREYEEILGKEIEKLVIPVKPGRNTSMIIEVAAMNFRQRGMGIDAAQEFTQKLSKVIDK